MSIRTVLVVEDSEECASIITLALSTVPSMHVRTVRTAEDAIVALESITPDALVTDLQLPGMDGLKLIALLRSTDACCLMPILVLSGVADPQASERALAAGADAFFRKPFSPLSVRLKLEALIRAK